MIRSTFLAATVLLALCAGCRSPSSGGAGARRPYNVLFISIDTLRPDFLGCYGHRPKGAPDVSPSPHLDALAAAGVRMEDAYASSSWTVPTHVSMMTGLSPLAHGIDTDEQAFEGPEPTLAEILRRHGYRTAGVFSGPYLDASWGFDRGFETYRACYGPTATRALERRLAMEAETARATAAGDAEAVARLARERVVMRRRFRKLWLRDVSSPHVTRCVIEDIREFARQDAPWLVFAHYFDPHEEYVPPHPYRTRFATDDAEPGLDHLRALYEGEIAWVDEHIGKLLAVLDALALAAHTLVIVVSDHGEEFLEHGGLGHRQTLYEEVLRIPLLLRLPGVLPAGKVVPGLVSTADLLPTILDILELPERKGWTGSRSFIPLIGGAETPAERDVLARLVTFQTGSAVIDETTSIPAREVTVAEAFRRGPIKITRRRAWPQFGGVPPEAARAFLQAEADRQYGTEHLSWIDVERFPAEPPEMSSDRFHDSPAAATALRAFQARYRRLLPADPRPRTARIAPEVRSALRALGYVGDGSEPTEIDLRLPLPGEGVLR